MARSAHLVERDDGSAQLTLTGKGPAYYGGPRYALPDIRKHFQIKPLPDAGEAERLADERDEMRRQRDLSRGVVFVRDATIKRLRHAKERLDTQMATIRAQRADLADRDATIKHLQERLASGAAVNGSLRAELAPYKAVAAHMRDQSVCGWLKHALDALKALDARPPGEREQATEETIKGLREQVSELDAAHRAESNRCWGRTDRVLAALGIERDGTESGDAMAGKVLDGINSLRAELAAHAKAFNRDCFDAENVRADWRNLATWIRKESTYHGFWAEMCENVAALAARQAGEPAPAPEARVPEGRKVFEIKRAVDGDYFATHEQMTHFCQAAFERLTGLSFPPGITRRFILADAAAEGAK